MSNPRQLLWPLLLVLATLLAYSPVLRGGFIWDDDDYVTDNPVLRNTEGLRRIWMEPSSLPQYYPVVHTVLWLEARAFGFRAPGYHVVNVLLHALAALLFGSLLHRLRISGARLASALFALHPLMVESAAWITEHKNTLSLVFVLLASNIYLKRCLAPSSPNPRTRRTQYVLALAFFVLALLSKSVTCSMPAVLLVIIWWKNGRMRRDTIVSLAPFFLLGAVMALVTVSLEKHHVLATGAPWAIDFFARTLIAARALWFYLAKLVLPIGLSFNYHRWDPQAVTAASLACLFAAVLLPALLWHQRRRWGRGPLAVLLIYGGVLFPALGFIDTYPMRYSFVADHFTYHAILAPIAGLAVAFTKLTSSWNSRSKAAAGLLLFAVLSTLTFHHATSFRDIETLWRDTLDGNPDSWLAANNLAGLLLDRGSPEDLEESLRLSDRVIAMRPDQSAAAWANRGVALFRMGRDEEARSSLLKATRLDPDSPQAWGNLGVVSASRGDLDDAVAFFRKAVALEPRFAEARRGLVLTLARQGNAQAALRELKRLRGAHSSDGILLQLARTLEKGGSWDAAAAVVAQFVQRHPAHIDARRLAAHIEEGRRQPARALTIYLSILAQHPDDAEGRSRVLELARSFPNPMQAVERAGHGMQVPLAALSRDLALLLLEDGKRQEARRVLERGRSLAKSEGRRDLLDVINRLLSTL